MARLNGQQRAEQRRLRRERIRTEKEPFKKEQENIRTRQEQAILDSAREEKFLQAKARAVARAAENAEAQAETEARGVPRPGSRLAPAVPGC